MLKNLIKKIKRSVETAPTPTETWLIDKEFGFDYGHRVWSQKLNTEYSIDCNCVCRHLHGHRGTVHVFLEAPALTNGMVTDFKHLNWFKQFVDDCVDHKFILDLSDPWFANIINAKPVYGDDGILKVLSATQPLNTTEGRTIVVSEVFVPGTDFHAGYSLDVEGMQGPEKEFYEGFFLVDFLPTSENLSKWAYECIDAKMSQIDVRTARIDWYETPKSRSSYRKS